MSQIYFITYATSSLAVSHSIIFVVFRNFSSKIHQGLLLLDKEDVSVVNVVVSATVVFSVVVVVVVAVVFQVQIVCFFCSLDNKKEGESEWHQISQFEMRVKERHETNKTEIGKRTKKHCCSFQIVHSSTPL